MSGVNTTRGAAEAEDVVPTGGNSTAPHRQHGGVVPGAVVVGGDVDTLARTGQSASTEADAVEPGTRRVAPGEADGDGQSDAPAPSNAPSSPVQARVRADGGSAAEGPARLQEMERLFERQRELALDRPDRYMDLALRRFDRIDERLDQLDARAEERYASIEIMLRTFHLEFIHARRETERIGAACAQMQTTLNRIGRRLGAMEQQMRWLALGAPHHNVHQANAIPPNIHQVNGIIPQNFHQANAIPRNVHQVNGFLPQLSVLPQLNALPQPNVLPQLNGIFPQATGGLPPMNVFPQLHGILPPVNGGLPQMYNGIFPPVNGGLQQVNGILPGPHRAIPHGPIRSRPGVPSPANEPRYHSEWTGSTAYSEPATTAANPNAAPRMIEIDGMQFEPPSFLDDEGNVAITAGPDTANATPAPPPPSLASGQQSRSRPLASDPVDLPARPATNGAVLNELLSGLPDVILINGVLYEAPEFMSRGILINDLRPFLGQGINRRIPFEIYAGDLPRGEAARVPAAWDGVVRGVTDLDEQRWDGDEAVAGRDAGATGADATQVDDDRGVGFAAGSPVRRHRGNRGR